MDADAQAIHEMVVADFQKEWQGEVSPEELQAALGALSTSPPSRPASGSVTSVVAVAWFTIDAQFTGEFKGWVVGATIAEGPFSGYVYSNDFSRLTSTTTNFWYFLAASYTSISFYDANSVNLGYFEGTSIGLAGGGGGPGGWNTI